MRVRAGGPVEPAEETGVGHAVLLEQDVEILDHRADVRVGGFLRQAELVPHAGLESLVEVLGESV